MLDFFIEHWLIILASICYFLVSFLGSFIIISNFIINKRRKYFLIFIITFIVTGLVTLYIYNSKISIEATLAAKRQTFWSFSFNEQTFYVNELTFDKRFLNRDWQLKCGSQIYILPYKTLIFRKIDKIEINNQNLTKCVNHDN